METTESGKCLNHVCLFSWKQLLLTGLFVVSMNLSFLLFKYIEMFFICLYSFFFKLQCVESSRSTYFSPVNVNIHTCTKFVHFFLL